MFHRLHEERRSKYVVVIGVMAFFYSEELVGSIDPLLHSLSKVVGSFVMPSVLSHGYPEYFPPSDLLPLTFRSISFPLLAEVTWTSGVLSLLSRFR